MATYNTWLATYNATNGTSYPPAVIYGYEGGYACGLPSGCTLSNSNASGYSGTAGGFGIICLATSHDIIYNPAWRIYEKDFFALVQASGFVDNAIYGYCYPAYYANLWSVINWPAQPYGKGDGSDGKANNKLCMATPATLFIAEARLPTKTSRTSAFADRRSWSGWGVLSHRPRSRGQWPGPSACSPQGSRSA